MRRMAMLVVLPIFAAGCGSSTESSTGTSAGGTPSPAATRPASNAERTGYTTPMQIAAKIKKAGLGCANPKPAEVLGGKKVTCTVGGEHVNVEVYPSEKVFSQVMKATCGMGVKPVSATDGRTWDVTPDTARTAKRLQKVVGGRAEDICDHV